MAIKKILLNVDSQSKIFWAAERDIFDDVFLHSVVLKMTIFLDVSGWVRPIPYESLAKIRPNKGGLVLRTLESKIENHA